MPRAHRDSTAEEEPLLPTQNGETGGRQQGKLSSFLSLFSKQSPPLRGESGLEEGEDEYERAANRQGVRSAVQWRTWTLYVVLLGLGGLLGWFFTSRWDATHHHNEGKEGPMVPPVWTLPPPTGLPRNPSYLIEAHTAAVASEDVTCSNLGLSIMRDKNGTAVDAAVTTTLCIGLLNAFSSGIGGGGFMLVRVPESQLRETTGDARASAEVTAIDFRETSPKASEKEMYGKDKAGRAAAQVGGLAVGVPGELRGLEEAHRRYGRLKWEEVVMPVAKLARGWQVSRELARRLRIFGQFMLESPTWSSVYAPRGSLLVEGDYVQRINYGKTLERIAKEGVEAFYSGEIAENMVNTVREAGGVLTVKDLAGYKPRAYAPIRQRWMGKEIYTTNAPSSGAAMLGMLNILEPYNFHLHGGLSNSTNVFIMLEAMKFAFGARSEITDPAFAHNISRMDEFATKEWAHQTRKLITNTTHDVGYYGLQHDVPIDHGTTHLSVVDQWGGAASVTSTVNLIWGSHVMCPHTGVIFNDEQDDFSVPGAPDAFGLLPSPYNYPAPGKRPLSSTAATIVHDAHGRLHAVLGGSGGSRIFPSIAQVLLHLEAGLTLSEAVEHNRYHNQIVPPLTTIEVGPEGEPTHLLEALRARGDKVGVFDINVGVAEIQAILVQNGTIWATSDSRKNGVAAGY